MKRAPRVMLCAGESSGDRLGAGLAEALRRRRPDISLFGMGGGRMRDAGVEIVQDAAAVSVVGIVEVLGRLGSILAAMRRLTDEIDRRRPDLLVPIDFPDFNLRLAARARERGVGVVYWVSPQVWAWRRGRVKKIGELVRRMLVLFPFETEVYEEAGVPVTFVGHPLAEPGRGASSREDLARAAGLHPGRETLMILPGSRRSEVSRILPPAAAAFAALARERPGLQGLLPLAPDLEAADVAPTLAAAGAEEVRIHRGDWPRVLDLGTAGIVASGTASLEAALRGLPLVVVYRVSPLTYAVGRRLVELDHVALPNLVAGRRVVPELIQQDCRAETIADAVRVYLDDEPRRARIADELRGLRARLGGAGAFDRTAEAVLAELAAMGHDEGP